MIIVTGGAGFIGSQLILGLNALGYRDILVVDDLTDGHKFKNLLGAEIVDYWDQETFLQFIVSKKEMPQRVEAIFHEGACSSTTEWNGRYLMNNNYEYSKQVLHYAIERKIPLSYASSAAVYGNKNVFEERFECEVPVNMYGYSKYQFDQYVRWMLPKIKSQVVGFRYFNVFGPNEGHKGNMASVAWHFYQQLKNTGTVKLFQGSGGYADGEQRRDFIYIKDVVKVKLWFMQQESLSGIFNLGTGKARSFNDVARAVIAWYGSGRVDYIPFPETLKGAYQSYTQADITALRKAGFAEAFTELEPAISDYMEYLKRCDHER